MGETDGLEAKAKASGAVKLYVGDLKEEFVRDYVFPCVRAGAVYERKYLLGTSMARPIIAKVGEGGREGGDGGRVVGGWGGCEEYHSM